MFKINDRVWVLPFEEIVKKSEEGDGDGRYLHYRDEPIHFNHIMKDHCGREYQIHKILSDGGYRLKTPAGEMIGWTWCDWMLTDENPTADYSDDSEEDDFWDEPYEDEDETETYTVEDRFREAIAELPLGGAAKILESKDVWEVGGHVWREFCVCPVCHDISEMIRKRANEDENRPLPVVEVETKAEIAPVRESYVLVHNSEFKGILDLTEAEAEAIITVICAIDTDTDILTIAQAKEEFRL